MRRFASRAWYSRHRAEIGYVAGLLAIAFLWQDNRDLSHSLADQSKRQAIAISSSHDAAIREAVLRANCSQRLLVIRATPSHPRARTADGKPLKYTKEQKRQVREARRALLKGLPSKQECASISP